MHEEPSSKEVIHIHPHLRKISAALTFAAAFGLGAYGMYLHDWGTAQWPGYAAIGYHTLQLFVVNGQYLSGPIPWQLNVARFLALLPTGIALSLVIRHFLPDEWSRLRRLFSHSKLIVICGLGELGATLAKASEANGYHATAIEINCPPGTRQQMQRCGVLVLDGDARDVELLKAAHVQSAAEVIISCADDQTNLTVLGALAALPAPRRRGALPLCRVMIAEPELRHAVTASGFSLRAAGLRLNARDLDRHAVAARQALRGSPLDFARIGPDEDTRVRLVVVGFGAAGMALALNAMEMGHFANETPLRRLQVVVMDRDRTGLEKFLSLHGQNIANVCELSFHPQPESARRMLDELAQLSRRGEDHRLLTTYAFCAEGADGDALNFTRGMELHEALPKCDAQILLRQGAARGTAALLANCPAGAGSACRVRAFGMSEEVYSWENLLREQDDLMAKAIQHAYAEKHEESSWEDLSDVMQESNRYAAEHIAVKLRAVGCEIAALTPGRAAADFSGEEVELMAQMEHRRWCAERYLDGWEKADVKNSEKKLNPSLVAWEQLSPENQSKDRDQIRALHETLGAAKLGIYRA